MSVKRAIGRLSGAYFFETRLPIYVNRAVESFELVEHQHDFLEISYVCEGSGTHYTSDRSFHVAQGELIVIPVGVSHVFRPSSPSRKQQLVVYNCILATDAFEAVLQAFPGGNALEAVLRHRQLLTYHDRDGECDRLFRRLHLEYASQRLGREAALYTIVLELLLLIRRMEEDREEAVTVRPPSGMHEVLRLLQAHCEQPLEVRELAALMGVGERQFQRLFAKHTGTTPKSYVQGLRIQAAGRLLRQTDRKISDIASAVGYQDAAFFTSLFKRMTGVTPQQYRQRGQSKED
ncbi:helix-turn-helix domain-containing protein [Paenibacillus puerhi]|uniref:helix-turn-helix domain-containing protein n=1 Tax=Paenibacillus puerhi TaxID=2692622 RepID=UPI00135A64C5|nr:helix-turn-helix domain-containing protein [Paenibacillus puerhi]